MDSDFKSLPTTMESEELANYFHQFLDIYTNKPKSSQALAELYELAYRQWDTYDRLDEELSQKISNYLIAAININMNTYEIMDVIISIVENLSLAEVFEYLISKRDSVKNKTVAKLIEEAEDEYAERINDPFAIDDF